MALSAILLKGKGKAAVDKDLDTIFQTSAGPSSISLFATGQEQDETKRSGKRRVNIESNDQNETVLDRGLKKRKEARSDTSITNVINQSYHGGSASSPESGRAESSGEDSDNEGPLVHESLMKKPQSRPKSGNLLKKKYVPDDETREQRDRRSIFIGNVPSEVAKSRPALKKLKKHVLEHVPEAVIESIRLRSIPFSSPVAPLGEENKKHRQQSRAVKWREEQISGNGDEKPEEKTYLNSKEKRKLAFIKGDLHEQADSIHAYVVFAHPIPEEQRPKNVPYKEAMDPFEATIQAVEKCDGTIFMNHTLRVDHVAPPTQSAYADASSLGAQTDPRFSVFVGNLDFASTEQDLRAFFETIICAERGAPAGNDNTSNRPRSSWVTRVRIVRDRGTQVGKGFAYVQFADRDCVDEVLALEQDKLKFAKRKLRVQRCKVLPVAGDKKPQPRSSASSRKSKDPREPPLPSTRSSSGMPKPSSGDPALGIKLAGLSKEMRKQVKATDANRIARRLAKKKARLVLERKGLKSSGKVRVRERKNPSVAGKSLNKGRKLGKGRVRSDRAVAKKNMKKQ